MWEAIELSYEKLSDAEKKKLNDDDNPFVSSCKFTGFDGHNEAEYIGIAGFLIDQLQSWSHFKGRDLNSHLPFSLENYRRMLPVFEPHHLSQKRFNLTAVELREILKMQHPEIAKGAAQ